MRARPGGAFLTLAAGLNRSRGSPAHLGYPAVQGRHRTTLNASGSSAFGREAALRKAVKSERFLIENLVPRVAPDSNRSCPSRPILGTKGTVVRSLEHLGA